jgi:hypothetical protein
VCRDFRRASVVTTLYLPAKKVLIASANFVRPSCLESIASNWFSASSSWTDSLLREVKPIIFIPESIRRSSDAAWTPFGLGKLRSMMTFFEIQ